MKVDIPVHNLLIKTTCPVTVIFIPIPLYFNDNAKINQGLYPKYLKKKNCHFKLMSTKNTKPY